MSHHGPLLRPVTRALQRAESTAELRDEVCAAAVSAGYDYALFVNGSTELASAGDPPADSTDLPLPADDDGVGGSERGADKECRAREDGGAVADTTGTQPVETAAHGDDYVVAVPVSESERRYGTLLLGTPTDPEDAALERLGGIGATIGTGLGKLTEARARNSLQETLRIERRQFEKLHSVAAAMVECDDPLSIYHLAIDAAENILDFDICGIDTVEDGYLVPKVTSTGMEAEDSQRMPADEGIGGRTYQNNETIIVDDVVDHPDGRPANPEYRSVLSVPIEDFGIFQAGSKQRRAFTNKDAELVELLLAHTSETLQRLRSEDALRESEQKYRTLIEQSHDAVTIHQDGHYAFVNQRATELFGRDEETLLECDVRDVVHPDDHDKLYTMDGADVSLGDQRTFEARIRHSDGDLRYCEFSTTVITYGNGPALLASIRDITERKERERELERQNERLDEFASVVSHDLRSPINVARGSVDLAQQTGEEEHLERAENALDRMEDLVGDILDLARQGQLVDETAAVAIREVAIEAWQTVDSPAATLDVDVEATVQADRVRLRELFENLFRNAVEHGGDDVTVTIDRRNDGFVVQDDGPGIPEDVEADLFERGFTTSDEGTGFGLAIVRNIAEAHDWSVETCEEGDGACFVVSGCRLE